jgi:hypothetical protein
MNVLPPWKLAEREEWAEAVLGWRASTSGY